MFQDILNIIAAFGFGAIISGFVQSYLHNRHYEKNRIFSEKKEAYIGLLSALRRASIENSQDAAKEFAYWQMRCELVSKEKVHRAIQEMIDSNDDIEERRLAFDNLRVVLRNDLGIAN